MKINFYLLIVCITILLLFSACSDQSHKEVLENQHSANLLKIEDGSYIFKPKLYADGKKYRMSIQKESIVDIEIDGKRNTSTNNTEIALLYEVLLDSNQNPNIKLTYEKLIITFEDSKGSLQVLDADNSIKGFKTVDNVLGAIKGTSVYITFNEKGEFSKILGSKEMSDKVLNTLTDLSQLEREKIQELIIGLSGDEFIKNNVGNSYSVFPDSIIREGDSWQKKNKLPPPLALEHTSNYKLTTIKGKIATVKSNSKISKSDNEIFEFLNNDVTVSLKGDDTDELKIDLLTGMLVQRLGKSTLKGNVIIRNRTFPIHIKQKRKLEMQPID